MHDQQYQTHQYINNILNIIVRFYTLNISFDAGYNIVN